MSKAYPLFGIGLQGKSANVTAMRALNLYAEIQAIADKTKIAFYPTPGTVLRIDFGDTPARGMHTLREFHYIVHRAAFWRVNGANEATFIGNLATNSGRVSMDNNGIEVMVVDGPNGYIYNVAAGTLTQITDPDFPGGDTVAFQDGRFIVNKPNSGRFYLSDPYAGLVWDALMFANAETNPDNLVAVIADHGQLVLPGETSAEFWGDSGNTDFPYARLGGAVVEYGLAARWSLCKFDNSLAWLAQNRMGEVQVIRLEGTAPARISTFELEDAINDYGTVSDATAFSYMLGGHPMLQLNFPSAGKSWLYDQSSKMWSPLESNSGRHVAEIGIVFNNAEIVSDYQNGKIYTLDGEARTDNGALIARSIVGRHVFDEENVPVHRLWIDMEGGVGLTTGAGENPQAMLSVSKDGGHTWSNERWTSIGRVGRYSARAIWNILGRAQDWLFKIRVTDPVKTVFIGAWIKAGK